MSVKSSNQSPVKTTQIDTKKPAVAQRKPTAAEKAKQKKDLDDKIAKMQADMELLLMEKIKLNQE